MLNFTATEKRALLITLGIVILAALIQYFTPHNNYYQKFDYTQADSVFYRLSKEKFNHSGTVSHTPKPNNKKLSSKPEPHSIDLNTANKIDLEKLPRVGPKMAERIITYRNSIQKFSTNEQLMKVKGIGPKTFEKIKPYLKEIKNR